MPSRTMSESQVQRFIYSMEDQGVGVTRTKKGLFLRLPDGESTTVHFTNSDVRAIDNLIARLRRAGVRHPEDPKNVAQLPRQITEGDVSRRTKDKVLAAMQQLDYPDSVRVVQMAETAHLEHVTTSRALYHMGFTPIEGKRNARDWLTPEEILALKPAPPVEPEVPDVEQGVAAHDDLMKFVEGANAAQAAVDAMGMGRPDVSRETVVRNPNREFLDTHDSWVVELQQLPMSMTIGDYLQALDASGLDFEVRLWRRV